MHFSMSSLHVMGWLLWCDVRLFLLDWKNNILNAFAWPLVLIGVNAYVMPALGLPESYGVFNSLSMLVIMASFTSWTSAHSLAADLESTRAISYDLSLPLPYWLVYLKNILNFALKAAVYSIMSLVIGKLLLWSSFDLSSFSPLKFLLIYLSINLFFGTFAVWAACWAGSADRFMHLELRLAGPLFFVCGYSFSWFTLYAISPLFAKAMLLTPWIYAYEGIRASVLGQSGYLSIWLCLAMIWFFIGIFGFLGMKLFKRKLDCI